MDDAYERRTKILVRQYEKFMKSPAPNPHLLCAVDEQDVGIWYFLLGGLDIPYCYGEYIFKLTAPSDFPMSPPRFEFLTQNGVFEPGGAICISIGEFHAKDAPGKHGAHGFRATLGMSGFADQIPSALICPDQLEGIRIKNRPDSSKRRFANRSREKNKIEFPELCSLFEDIITRFPESEPVRNITDARLRFESKIPPPRLPVAAPVAVSVAAPVAAPVAASRPDNLASGLISNWSSIFKPASIESDSIESASIEPASIEPASIEPASIESDSIEPVAVEPASIEAAAVEPVAVEPVAVELAAVESVPIEPANTGSEPVVASDPIVEANQDNDLDMLINSLLGN